MCFSLIFHTLNQLASQVNQRPPTPPYKPHIIFSPDRAQYLLLTTTVEICNLQRAIIVNIV